MPYPTHTGPVTLADCPTAYSILRKNPLTLTGQFGVGWSGTIDFRVSTKPLAVPGPTPPAVSDLYTFAQFAAGNPYTVGTATRIIPLSHPDAPTLLCTGVKATAMGGYTATNSEALQNWSDAQVSLTFTSVPYLTDGSTPFMVTETQVGAEVYTLAGSKLKFPSDNTYINADAGVTIPTIVYTVTIYMAASLNDSVLNPIAGCVNNGTFLGQSIGTLRFDGYTSRSTMTSTGIQSYTRTLMLTWRPVPWNQFLRPNGVWEAAQTPAGANVYAAADFTPLTA